MTEFFKNIELRLWDNPLSPASIVDILLVAFILYRMFLLIRGTRAEQLIKGLLVLVGIMVAAQYLHLYTLSWLLSKFLTALAVMFPIVFQPELRRALEKLGGGKFFAPSFSLTEVEAEKVKEEIIRAVKYLARRRIGALLVIERNTGLEEYVDSGTRLDAVVSAELLINIFIPNTPLHDGAVIIRGQRVAAAACVLPLTERSDVSRELGTRHRAALGISELADALVIVVSEETGTISVALEGNLYRYLEESDLRRYLEEKCRPTTAGLTSLLKPRR